MELTDKEEEMMEMVPGAFLKRLNDPRDQGDLFARYEWAQQFDLVMIGTCSTGNGRGYSAQTIARDGRPNPEYFEDYLKEYQPKKVLLISECCGAYDARFQGQLKEMYSEIEWIVPNVPNYGECLQFETLAEDLVCLDILLDTSKPK